VSDAKNTPRTGASPRGKELYANNSSVAPQTANVVDDGNATTPAAPDAWPLAYGLRQRRAAALRLPSLANGRRDPLSGGGR